MSEALRQRNSALAAPPHAARWIRDGWATAEKEPASVFESIEAKHAAEVAHGQAVCDGLKVRGQGLLEERNRLVASLGALHFDPAQHLRSVVQGKVDLAWAVGLTVLNAALAAFVLLGFGPVWVTGLLALLVLATAGPVEEFFQAHEDQTALREGIFLTLSIAALSAQFWLGTVRGLFLVSFAPVDAGPTAAALHRAGEILQTALGTMALVVECLCGYKWHRVRSQMFSATARAVQARERCDQELVRVAAALRAAQVEPGIRRTYRQIGARQYLAAQQRAAAIHQQNHLRRAVLGTLVAVLVLGALLLTATAGFGAPQEPQDVFVLLDLSKSVRPEAFTANVRATRDVLAGMPADARVVVVGITDSFARPRILLDRTLPSSGYLDLQVKVTREALVADWRQIARELRPEYARTDILGSLALLPYLVDRSLAGTRLIVFSDLRQSAEVDLETVPRVQVLQTLLRLKRAERIPNLKGAQVFLLGVDPSGKSAAYFASLKDFWMQLFAQAGAEVRAFSISRRVPGY